MNDTQQIAHRISSLCGGLWLPRYTSCKIKTDPLYGGIYKELEGRRLPLLDIGCGVGILAMYLRERSWKNPVTGIDYDKSKIDGGKKMIAKGGYEGISLAQGDARMGLPEHQGDVTILDIMQFFENEEQKKLLKAAASRVAPGGKLLIRSGLLEKNARFFNTWLGDVFARCTFWMRAAPVHYPTGDFFRETLGAEGFSVEVLPFWGKTPFNNYLIVAKRLE
jgi:2-polyprenyl-3-methyl-5-hydroxy-6-metoxy-1,4-benzoquinol methylase